MVQYIYRMISYLQGSQQYTTWYKYEILSINVFFKIINLNQLSCCKNLKLFPSELLISVFNQPMQSLHLSIFIASNRVCPASDPWAQMEFCCRSYPSTSSAGWLVGLTQEHLVWTDKSGKTAWVKRSTCNCHFLVYLEFPLQEQDSKDCCMSQVQIFFLYCSLWSKPLPS